jgi:hypothetical protein
MAASLRSPVLRRAVGVGWTLLVLAAVSVLIGRDPSAVGAALRVISPLHMAIAAGSILGAKLLLAETFGAIALLERVPLTWRQRQHVYHQSQLAKYLPGFVWQFASKGFLLRAVGSSTGQSARIIATEQVWILGGAAIVGGGLLLLVQLSGGRQERSVSGLLAVSAPRTVAATAAAVLVAVAVGLWSARTRRALHVPSLTSAARLLGAWLVLSASLTVLAVPHLVGDPGGDEVGRVHGAFHVQAFAEIDGILAAGRGHDLTGLLQMGHGGEGRFVGEVVLARAHDLAADRAAFGGHGGGGDEMNGRVVKDFVEAAGDLHARELALEGLELGRIGVIDPFELAAGFDETVALAVDVTVFEVGGGENEFAGLDHGLRFAFGGVGHAVGCLAHGKIGGGRVSGDHAPRRRARPDADWLPLSATPGRCAVGRLSRSVPWCGARDP